MYLGRAFEVKLAVNLVVGTENIRHDDETHLHEKMVNITSVEAIPIGEIELAYYNINRHKTK